MIHSICISILLLLSSHLFIHSSELQPDILWGVSERQGRRPSMEDTYIAVVKEKMPQLFGIFDGHGGSAAAQLTAQYFGKYFSYAQPSDGSAISMIKKIFLKTNQDILRSTSSGTTAIIGYIEQGNQLYIAWAGDSRAVLGNSHNKVIYETKDHKPSDPQEEALINARRDTRGRQCLISFTNPPRVSGILGVSRALGDRDVATCITAEPEVFSVQLKPKEHKFLILACDGIWDVLSSQEALDIVNRIIIDYQSAHAHIIDYSTIHQDITERIISREQTTERGNSIMVYAARELIDAAYQKGSTDNLSAMVILFDWEGKTYEAHRATVTPNNIFNRMWYSWNSFWKRIRAPRNM